MCVCVCVRVCARVCELNTTLAHVPTVIIFIDFRISKVTTLKHGKYYAVKRVSKKQIVAKRQEEHVLFEKKILKAIQSDFIVR